MIAAAYVSSLLRWLAEPCGRTCEAPLVSAPLTASLPAGHFVPVLAWETIPAVNGATVRQPSP
jgi:hypothetical protein